MRILALFVSLSLVCFAQQPKRVKPATEKDAPPKASESFAKASLIALKAIEADSSKPAFSEGQTLVNAHVQELIEAADVEASSPTEQTLIVNLRRLMVDKETNNLKRHTIALNARTSIYQTGKFPNDTNVSEIMDKNPDFIEMKAKEALCFYTFEVTLKNRSASFPEACENIAPGKS